MSKAAFGTVTLYFFLTMFASGMASNAYKLAILRQLGDPGFLGLMASISFATVLCLDIGLSHVADSRSWRAAAGLSHVFLGAFALSLLHISPAFTMAAGVLYGLGLALLSGIPGAFAMEAMPDKERRLAWLSRMDILLLAGSFIGNALGIWIFMSFNGLVFVLAAALFFIGVALTPVLLPKNPAASIAASEKNKEKGGLAALWKMIAEMFSVPGTRMILALSVLSGMVFRAVQTYWIVVFVKAQGSADMLDPGRLIFFTSVVTGAQILADMLSSRFPVRRIGIFLAFPAIAALPLVFWAPDSASIMIVMVSAAILAGKLCLTISYVYFQNRLASDRRATFASMVATVSSIGAMGLILGVAPLMKTHADAVLATLICASMALLLALTMTHPAAREPA